MVAVVINYYRRPEHPPALQHSLALAISSLQLSERVKSIAVVDGSAQEDETAKSICGTTGARYLHTGRELSFAEGYNTGIAHFSDHPIIGLMASDVYPNPAAVEAMVKMLEREDVACVFPYLDYCDYKGQTYSFVKKPVSCEPSCMTLNLNLFKTEALRAAGGVDSGYSGAYNDVILLANLRKLGMRCVLTGYTRVCHLGGLTLKGGSQYALQRDTERFRAAFPQYVAKHGLWRIKHWIWPFATTRRNRLLWYLAQNWPAEQGRRRLERLAMRMEPLNTALRA